MGPQEPPPKDFSSSDPGTEHLPVPASAWAASYSTFCSILSKWDAEGATSSGKRCPSQSPSPIQIPVLASSLQSQTVTMAFTPQRCCRPVEGEVLPYLPNISCPMLSCYVQTASHKPFNLPPAPWFGPAMLEGASPYPKRSYKVRSGPLWGLPNSSYCYGLLYG